MLDDSLADQMSRDPVGPADWVGSRRGTTVGDDDEQRPSTRIAQSFPLHHLGRLHQPFGERCPPAGRQVVESLGRDLDRTGWRKGDLGRLVTEGDDADAVAPPVGIEQQRQDGRLDLMHPFPRRHRPRRIDDEHHQVGFASLPDGSAEVRGPQE